MKMRLIFNFSLWLQAFLCLHYRPATCEQQQPLGPQAPRLRNASLEDIDDISTVVIAAFSPLPDWQYLYQFHKDFPEEHKRCARDNVVRVLSDASYHARVIEAPANSNISVVAVAIWTQHNGSNQATSDLMTMTGKDTKDSKKTSRLRPSQTNACTKIST